jgi:hypothetical protein
MDRERRVADVADEEPDVVGREPGERTAFDELHRDEGPPLPLPDLVHGRHVGMRDAGRQPRLPEEALARLLVGVRQELERDAPVELGVLGLPDLAHAPAADELLADVLSHLHHRQEWCASADPTWGKTRGGILPGSFPPGPPGGKQRGRKPTAGFRSRPESQRTQTLAYHRR